MRIRGYARIAAILAVLGASIGTALAEETLYATSLRSHGNTGSFIAGSLYTVDPATGVATVIGPIRVGETAIGIVAVASHPKTGVFYGITAGLSPVIPRSLVTIDLANGNATVVAKLGAGGSDIGFAPDGTLYMWLPDTNQVARVDLTTGATTPLGPSGIEGVVGGGISINAAGDAALVAATGATGTIDAVDLNTGVAKKGPALAGAPYATSIDNLTTAPSGILYAVNSNGGAPSSAALVTIDPATGVVAKIGALPDDTRGLIFAPKAESALSPTDVKKWVLAFLALVAAGLIAWAVFMK
jgi:hypothetical protein